MRSAFPDSNSVGGFAEFMLIIADLLGVTRKGLIVLALFSRSYSSRSAIFILRPVDNEDAGVFF